MTIASLIFIKIFLMGVIGPPITFLFDREGVYFWYLVKGRDIDYILPAYLWMLYGLGVLFALYWVGLRRLFIAYVNKPLVESSHRQYYNLWRISMIVASTFAIILFCQNKFSHPFLSTMGLDVWNFAIKRIETAQAINMNIYNIGLHFFTAFAMCLAFFFIKKTRILLLTFLFFVFFVTFSLAKSPMLEVLIQLLFIYLLIKRRIRLRSFLIFAAIAIFVILILIAVTARTSDFSIIWETVVERVFLGEFADLPSYFEIFKDNQVPFVAILPPYIQSAIGVSEKPPSKIVAEYHPDPSYFEVAGFANAFFIGSAYAFAGVIGAILSPFLVFLNLYVATRIFLNFQKDIFSVFIFGYVIYRLTNSFFSDISFFFFSGIQIMVFLFLCIKAMEQAVKVKIYLSPSEKRR